MIEENEFISYMDKFSVQYPGTRYWAERVWSQAQDGNNRLIYCLQKNETIQAMMVLHVSELKLCHLSVTPIMRGKGIGKLLFNEALAVLGSDLWAQCPKAMLSLICSRLPLKKADHEEAGDWNPSAHNWDFKLVLRKDR